MNYESRTVFRPIADKGDQVSFSSSSVQSIALRGGVYALCPSQTCYVIPGSNPTAAAAAGNQRIPADTLVYITVHKDEKIAVIRETTDGVLNITAQQ
jgi:hypothetical protein